MLMYSYQAVEYILYINYFMRFPGVSIVPTEVVIIIYSDDHSVAYIRIGSSGREVTLWFDK